MKFNKQQWSWIFYDWANSGYGIIVTTAVLPVYFKAVAQSNGVTQRDGILGLCQQYRDVIGLDFSAGAGGVSRLSACEETDVEHLFHARHGDDTWFKCRADQCLEVVVRHLYPVNHWLFGW